MIPRVKPEGMLFRPCPPKRVREGGKSVPTFWDHALANAIGVSAPRGGSACRQTPRVEPQDRAGRRSIGVELRRVAGRPACGLRHERVHLRIARLQVAQKSRQRIHRADDARHLAKRGATAAEAFYTTISSSACSPAGCARSTDPRGEQAALKTYRRLPGGKELAESARRGLAGALGARRIHARAGVAERRRPRRVFARPRRRRPRAVGAPRPLGRAHQHDCGLSGVTCIRIASHELKCY